MSKRFGFFERAEIQDWERHFADPSRLAEFLGLLRPCALNADERFILMELILASAAAAEPPQLTDLLWQEIADILVSDYAIHAWTVWFWASIDETTGIALNDFWISRRLQHVLTRVDDRRRLADGSFAPPLVPDFATFWQAHYSGHQPAGHCLRKTLADCWIRFHSLPGSQRHPESDAEIAVLLERQNRLATEILGDGESCWIFVGRAEDDSIGDDDIFAKYDWAEAFRWHDAEGANPDQPTTTYAAECIWFPGQVDDLLLQIANWKQSGILWASQSTGAVFAPYDGGMDLFLAGGLDVADLRHRHRDWLSPHPSGL